MKAEEALNISKKAIDSFTMKWRSEPPYRCMYEIDIQIGLFNEIQNQLKKENRMIKGRHSHDKGKLNEFSRVACEPYVKINKKERAIHPDIVIWGGEMENDNSYINYGFWPILWVCEIKYLYEAPNKDTENDTKRLRALLENDRAKFASQLIFLLSSGKTDRFDLYPKNPKSKIYYK